MDGHNLRKQGLLTKIACVFLIGRPNVVVNLFGAPLSICLNYSRENITPVREGPEGLCQCTRVCVSL